MSDLQTQCVTSSGRLGKPTESSTSGEAQNEQSSLGVVDAVAMGDSVRLKPAVFRTPFVQTWSILHSASNCSIAVPPGGQFELPEQEYCTSAENALRRSFCSLNAMHTSVKSPASVIVGADGLSEVASDCPIIAVMLAASGKGQFPSCWHHTLPTRRPTRTAATPKKRIVFVCKNLCAGRTEIAETPACRACANLNQFYFGSLLMLNL